MSSIRWAFSTKKWKPTKSGSCKIRRPSIPEKYIQRWEKKFEIQLHGGSEWIYGLSCTQEEERERIMKFVFKKDAKSALIGRLLLRKVIAEQLGIPYPEIRLGRTDKGKPYLIGPKTSDYHFNVSHQGDYVVLAGEPSIRVGIDVMKTEIKGNQSLGDFFHTMRRQFTSYEWQNITKQPSERKQLEMFLRHWCLKESYVKALGVGIGFAKKLQSIEFHITPMSIELNSKMVVRDTQMFLENKVAEQWCFEETKLDDDHQVAVALECSRLTQEEKTSHTGLFKFLTVNDLVPSVASSFQVEEQLWNDFDTKKECPWQR